jgi:hypothetical protein
METGDSSVQVTFANRTRLIQPHSIKITIEVISWPFSLISNRLQVSMGIAPNNSVRHLPLFRSVSFSFLFSFSFSFFLFLFLFLFLFTFIFIFYYLFILMYSTMQQSAPCYSSNSDTDGMYKKRTLKI